MSENVKAALNANAPWSENVAWWIVLIEGILSLGLGIYLFSDVGLGERAVLWIGLYLLIISLIRLLRAFIGRFPASIQMYRVLQGGIGLIVGLLVVLEPSLEFFSGRTALIILAIGLALSGLIGLVAVFAGRREIEMRPIGFLGPALTLVFGVLLFSATLYESAILLVQALAAILLLFGVILLIRAYFLYQKGKAAAEMAMATEGAATDTIIAETTGVETTEAPITTESAKPVESTDAASTDDSQDSTATPGGIERTP